MVKTLIRGNKTVFFYRKRIVVRLLLTISTNKAKGVVLQPHLTPYLPNERSGHLYNNYNTLLLIDNSPQGVFQ